MLQVIINLRKVYGYYTYQERSVRYIRFSGKDIKSYKERMKKPSITTHILIKNMEDTLRFRRTGDDNDKYEKKIISLTGRHLG